MPLKHFDPYSTKLDVLNANVNPYVASMREALATGSLPISHGAALRPLAGKWREHVAEYHGASRTSKKLVVEIGCHKGITLLAMAERHPDVAFIGVDITFKRVVTTAERAARAGLKNVFCVMANANALDQLFAPVELDGVILFFPDPWIKKKRQAKHRLVSPQFCEKLASRLSPDGFFWLKTDQKIYFDGAAEHLAATNFLPSDGNIWLGTDFTSAFEQRFHAQELPTYGGRWQRPAVLYSV